MKPKILEWTNAARLLVLVGAFVNGFNVRLSAQAIRVAGSPSAEQCVEAQDALRRGSGALDSLRVLRECPGGAQLVASAISTLPSVSSDVTADALIQLAAQFTDDRIASSALAVMRTGTSGDRARGWATLVGLAQLVPGTLLPTAADVPSNVQQNCMLGQWSSPVGGIDDVPLSFATRAALVNTAMDMYRSTTLSASSRWFANCVAFHGVIQRVPPDPRGADILLTYMCGNRFRVRNRNLVAVRVEYDVYGTSERGSVTLRRASFLPSGVDAFFQTTARGTVRLFFNGQLIQTKANGGRVC